MTRHWRVLIGVGIGALVTPLAALLALASMGAGHGDYAFAKLLFPYSMLLTKLANDTISGPLFALASVQFPMYGLAITFPGTGRKALAIVGAIAMLHLSFASACFLGLIPNFSPAQHG